MGENAVTDRHPQRVPRREPLRGQLPGHVHPAQGSEGDGGDIEGEGEGDVKEEPGDKSALEFAEGEGGGQKSQEEVESPQVPFHRGNLPSSGRTGTGILVRMSRSTRSTVIPLRRASEVSIIRWLKVKGTSSLTSSGTT